MAFNLTRDVPLEKGKAALLVIDMQRYCAEPGTGLFKDVDPKNIDEHNKYFFSRLYESVIPSLQDLLQAFREKKQEVIYTFIECLTKDGRDQSLDYKITGFCVPKGSPEAAIISSIAPAEDEILIPKTACSVFNSTNIEYVLRNLGVTQLVITGIVTNQCVESAVRDAADRGFLVTLVEDATATHTHQDHIQSLKNMKGFSRIVPHTQVVDEVKLFK